MIDGLMYGRFICEKPYELTKVDKIFFQSANETDFEENINQDDHGTKILSIIAANSNNCCKFQ